MEQLRTQLAEANEAFEQERGNLEESIIQLQTEFVQERSRGFFRRLFGLRPRLSENPEDTRQKMRGRLGVTTPQSAAVAQKTATQMAAQMANGTLKNGTSGGSTVGGQI